MKIILLLAILLESVSPGYRDQKMAITLDRNQVLFTVVQTTGLQNILGMFAPMSAEVKTIYTHT